MRLVGRRAPKDSRQLRQHLRSRIVCSGPTAQLPRLKVGNRFQQSTLTRRSLPGVSFNQLTRGPSYGITGGTRWTFLGQSKNVLKGFKQVPLRALCSRPAPVVRRRRLHAPCTPRVMGPAPEHLATVVTDDVPSTPEAVSRGTIPRDRVTAGAMCDKREPAA